MLRVSSSRCLIYKVHAAPRQELHCTTRHSVCQVLFSGTFQIPYSFVPARASHELLHVTTSSSPCQVLFPNFLWRSTALRLTRTHLCYHMSSSLSSTFFRSFPAAWPFSLPPQCFPRSAQLIYQIPPRLSTTFFDFFHFLYLEDKCPQKRPLRPIGNRATLLSSLYHTMTGGGQIHYAHQNSGPASGPRYLRK